MQLPDIPPLTTAKVTEALAVLGVEHDPLDMLSVTIDSEGMTLEVLSRDAGSKASRLFGMSATTHTIRVPWDRRSVLRG